MSDHDSHPQDGRQSPHAVAIETVYETSSTDRGITPLHPIVARRFLLLPDDEAEAALQAASMHGLDWYERAGLIHDYSSRHDAARHLERAQTGYGTAEEGGRTPVVEQASSAMEAEHQDDVAKQAWREDMHTVGSVFDSMLAEDDHGRV